jgi:putative ABC transport system permease protein
MAMDVREAVSEIGPAQPLVEIQTLEEVRRESLASPRLTMMLIGLFADLALAITTTGIGGVIAFTVSQRTSEIGLRMALGASRGSVLSMVLGQGMVLVFVGLGIGVLAALALGRLMSGLLFNIAPTDLGTFIAVLTTLSIVAVATCLIPARRATSSSPTEALRHPLTHRVLTQAARPGARSISLPESDFPWTRVTVSSNLPGTSFVIFLRNRY